MTRGERTRERIEAAAYWRFYREGFARVSLDDIAAAAGVTKKTLYYHYESKDVLIGRVLEAQHAHAFRMVRGWVDKAADNVDAFIANLFEELGRWASKAPWHGSGFTRISNELADMPGHPARVASRRHKRLVEEWMTGRMREFGVADAETAARQIVLLIEGAMTLMLIHGDTAYASTAGDAARSLVRRAGRRARRRSHAVARVKSGRGRQR